MNTSVDNEFVQATEDLIALYRKTERRSLDLPAFSIKPLLVFFWAILKFSFFFYVGIFLIIPVNFVIMIRNFFPGRWKYRPFFLSYLHYVWMWVWRGEAPSAPLIFVRPLFNVFMKVHFQRRLQRLRREIQLHDGLSDATRSALANRLNAAIEEWNVPRLTAAVFALPAAISVLEAFAKLMEWLDIRISVSALALVSSESMSRADLITYGGAFVGYLVGIPVTAFIAKRGIFLGADSGRVYYPGEKDGPGNYAVERDILGKVGLRMREVPFDLWLAGITFVFFNIIQIALVDEIVASYSIPDGNAELRYLTTVVFLRLSSVPYLYFWLCFALPLYEEQKPAVPERGDFPAAA